MKKKGGQFDDEETTPTQLIEKPRSAVTPEEFRQGMDELDSLRNEVRRLETEAATRDGRLRRAEDDLRWVRKRFQYDRAFLQEMDARTGEQERIEEEAQERPVTIPPKTRPR